MALTYSPIIGTETDPDAPLTSSLAKRWSENWEAGFEGQAANAPRLMVRALQRLTAGSVTRITAPLGTTPLGGSLLILGFGLIQFGTIRISGTLAGGANPPAFIVQRKRSNVTTTLFSSSGVGAKTVDVSVIPGDLISVLASAGSGSTATISNLIVSTNGEDIFPVSEFGLYTIS